MNITEECNKLFLLQKEYQEENKEVNKATPLVSVSVATYQHVNYIKECLDGILMQITNFPIEIIVGEDESNDGTREICIEYANKYPDKIRLFLRDRKQSQLYDEQGNFLTRFNGIWNRMSCRGKYIALCEGDDYWTDPYKLQKQVDFLEANEEYSFCFHDNEILNEITGRKTLRVGNLKIKDVVDVKEVIIENNISTASLVFRNILDYNNLPTWFLKTAKGDYGLVVLLAEKGLGKYLPDVMSVYRIHDGGVWSGNKQRSYHINEDIKFYNFLYDYFSQPHIRKAIKLKRSKSYQNLGINQIRDGQFFTGLLQVVTNWNFTNDKRFKTPLRKIASAVKTGLKFHLSNTNRNGL